VGRARIPTNDGFSRTIIRPAKRRIGLRQNQRSVVPRILGFESQRVKVIIYSGTFDRRETKEASSNEIIDRRFGGLISGRAMSLNFIGAA